MVNGQSKNQRETFRSGSFLIGSTFLIFYATLLVILSFALFGRIGVRHEGVLLSITLTALYFWWTGAKIYRLERRWFVICLLIVLFSSILVGLVAGYYFDLSWDGRDYQQRAVFKLASGWNPVYTVLQPDDIYKNAWLNHFPKGLCLACCVVRRFNFHGH